MTKKILLGLLFIIVAAGSSLKAQEEDTVSTNDKERWSWDWEDEWEDEWDYWEKGKPSIEFNYGLGEPKHDRLTSKLAKVGLAEAKLGYISFDRAADYIIEFDERYSFVSKLGVNLQSDKANSDELESELFRFGFGKRSGYGYDFNNLRILPYSQNAVVWSKLDMKDYPVSILPIPLPMDAVSDAEILDRFNKEIRFGTLSEGGIRLEAGKFISFNAGYEASVIFPRHLVWKHFVSFAIEAAGFGALDHFVEEVLDSSPAAAPLVNFVLKNGLSYAFYTLKKEKMNWPGNTETPLTYETIKFGVTFTF